jgi:hypothetical protein
MLFLAFYYLLMLCADDLEAQLHVLLALGGTWCIASSGLAMHHRNPSLPQQRMFWDEYLQTRQKDRYFRRHLRMELASFNKLLEMIREDLEVDEKMAGLRGGCILPELCLYCTLRWLAGGSYLDIHDRTGISVASFYRILWKTIKAIVKCKQLDLKFPVTGAECRAGAAGFRSKSFRGIIANCVGAVDGYLLRIQILSVGGRKVLHMCVERRKDGGRKVCRYVLHMYATNC